MGMLTEPSSEADISFAVEGHTVTRRNLTPVCTWSLYHTKLYGQSLCEKPRNSDSGNIEFKPGFCNPYLLILKHRQLDKLQKIGNFLSVIHNDIDLKMLL